MKDNFEVAQSTIKRIGGYLHRVVPITDKSGDVINYVLKPLMVEFKPRDIVQVIVGSTLLALPVSLTEEVWNLGESLPIQNVGLIALISIVLVAVFVYLNFYRFNLKGHVFNFAKRVIGTYIISLSVAILLLTVLEKFPWSVDNYVAIKRAVIVALPASLSGTLSDMIK